MRKAGRILFSPCNILYILYLKQDVFRKMAPHFPLLMNAYLPISHVSIEGRNINFIRWYSLCLLMYFSLGRSNSSDFCVWERELSSSSSSLSSLKFIRGTGPLILLCFQQSATAREDWGCLALPVTEGWVYVNEAVLRSPCGHRCKTYSPIQPYW